MDDSHYNNKTRTSFRDRYDRENDRANFDRDRSSGQERSWNQGQNLDRERNWADSSDWNPESRGDFSSYNNYGRTYGQTYGNPPGPNPGTQYGARNEPGFGTSRSDFGASSPTISHAGRGPKGYQRSDERIKEDVNETLFHHHEIDATEIEVEVKDGIVTLKGAIETRAMKRGAEDAIENLSGVKDVRNELHINQTLFQQAKEFFTGDSTEATRPAGTQKSGSKH